MPSEPGKTISLLDIVRISDRIRKRPEQPDADTAAEKGVSTETEGTLEEQVRLLKRLPQADSPVEKSPVKAGRPVSDLAGRLGVLVDSSRGIAGRIQMFARETEKYGSLSRQPADEDRVSADQKAAFTKTLLELERDIKQMQALMQSMKSYLEVSQRPQGERSINLFIRLTARLKRLFSHR